MEQRPLPIGDEARVSLANVSALSLLQRFNTVSYGTVTGKASALCVSLITNGNGVVFQKKGGEKIDEELANGGSRGYLTVVKRT